MDKASSDHEVVPDNTQRCQHVLNMYLSSFASYKYMLHMPDHKIQCRIDPSKFAGRLLLIFIRGFQRNLQAHTMAISISNAIRLRVVVVKSSRG